RLRRGRGRRGDAAAARVDALRQGPRPLSGPGHAREGARVAGRELERPLRRRHARQGGLALRNAYARGVARPLSRGLICCYDGRPTTRRARAMGRILKIVGIAVGAVVLLLVAAVVAIGYLVDPNDYKDDITRAVANATGRDVTIEGDLELKLFPTVRIAVGAAQISNAQGFGDE